MADTTAGETVHALPRLHAQSVELKQDPDAVTAHLYQLNEKPGAYANKMGCGAFTTTMAISHYHPTLGTYDTARTIFDKMIKVPHFGGTFECQNARMARQYGLLSKNYDHGTLADLQAAIDCGAPTILLVEPTGRLRIGQHDVLLVGYSLDASGKLFRFFVDNPMIESAPSRESPVQAQKFPGNASYTVPELIKTWTNCFTPFFGSAEAYARWRALTGRN
ncbi:MAG TPA: hypothetical protein VGE04_14285 [Chloroflexia bacterium]|jgi:hypothetical protein